MIITEQILKEAESINGAWSRKQLETIGIKWPPPKGWKKKIIGTKVDKSKIQKLLSLKNKHIESKLKIGG
ncbi:MAG TPA: hypothetical protein VLA13_03480 [Massilibacterium sp.]|nr:hypothetical protein [Massilibacterium sp.]